MKRVRVIVSGVVQGVGFRFFTRDLARRYELSGYVRNRADGTVEVEAEGTGRAVGAFLRELEAGPRGSHVAGICRLEHGVTIGAGATVIDSLTIGRNSVIGAGSVVTKDIPPDVVAYGAPARVIRKK